MQKSTQPNPSPNRGRSPSGRMFRLPCKDYLKGTCTTPFCDEWHPPENLFYKSENGCRFGEKCSCAHRHQQAQKKKRRNEGTTGENETVTSQKCNMSQERTPAELFFFFLDTLDREVLRTSHKEDSVESSLSSPAEESSSSRTRQAKREQ